MNDQASRTSVGGAQTPPSSSARLCWCSRASSAFYALRAQPDWQRWLAVVAGVVLAAVVFATSERGREFWRFMLTRGSSCARWSGRRQETMRSTAVVFGFVIIAGVFFWLLDVFLSWATRLLTGQGG